MNENCYKTARAVIYDDGSADRSGMWVVLREAGFEDIGFAASGTELINALRTKSPDLLICADDRADAQICDILRSLRTGRIGTNPFTIILAASWCTDDEIVGAYRDSGVDGFMSFPITRDSLKEFLVRQTAARRKFVATTDYVGPDRRRDVSRSGAECFDVLNSLKVKSAGASGDEVAAEIARELEVSLVRLNAERQRQNVVQLCVLWRLLEQRRPGTRDFSATLAKMGLICADQENRIGDSQAPNAREYCRTILSAIEILEQFVQSAHSGEGRLQPDLLAAMDRLGKSSLALADLFVPGALAPSKLFELDDLVATIDIRRCRTDAAANSFAAQGTNAMRRAN